MANVFLDVRIEIRPWYDEHGNWVTDNGDPLYVPVITRIGERGSENGQDRAPVVWSVTNQTWLENGQDPLQEEPGHELGYHPNEGKRFVSGILECHPPVALSSDLEKDEESDSVDIGPKTTCGWKNIGGRWRWVCS